MRRLRRALGLTVRDVAVQAGLGESSASYISQLECGAKTPHPGLAGRLAGLLQDDPRIYLAWAATGKRSDPVETARAVHLLGRLLGHARYEAATSGAGASRSAPAPGEPGGEGPLVRAALLASPQSGPDYVTPQRLPEVPLQPPPAQVPRARILVPEIEEGTDPGEDVRTSPRVLATHRVAADSLAGIEPPVRPFAFRVSAPGAQRVGDALAPGDLAIVSRRSWPPERFAPCVVRLSGHVVLSRILWNGRQLLLLPGHHQSDFIVLDAPDRTALERLIAGKVVAVIRHA